VNRPPPRNRRRAGASAEQSAEGSASAVAARLREAGCVFAEDEAGLLIAAAGTAAELASMVARRAAGQPLEHVIGWAEFHGLRIAVDPGVFVPRRRTEFLVDQAIALALTAGRPRPAVVIDMCCGSGAVGAALAAALGPVELYAVDIDPAAVRCARRNLASRARTDKGRDAAARRGEPTSASHEGCARAGRRVRVYQGDLFEPLPTTLRGRVDLIAANVPYVPAGEIALLPAEARLHEPRSALDGGADGLDMLRRLTNAAPAWLAPSGHVLIETSLRQAPRAANAFEDSGLTARVVHSADEEATVVIGERRA
jgi:release factor glutamine methyltransferase